MERYNIEAAKVARRLILKMSYRSDTGHIPSALSMCDYLGVLFELGVLPDKYRFILGKNKKITW